MFIFFKKILIKQLYISFVSTPLLIRDRGIVNNFIRLRLFLFLCSDSYLQGKRLVK